MRLNFPKRKKKRIPWYPLLSFFTIVLVIITIIGEGGVLHSLTMQVYRQRVEVMVAEKLEQNEELKYLLRQVRTNPDKMKTILAEKRGLTEDGAVIYQFKTVEEMPSIEMISEVEGLGWLQRTKLRWELTMKERLK
jgi:hypothetical protein